MVTNCKIAGNIYFIDPEILYEKKLLTENDLKECRSNDKYVTDYDFLHETREDVFRRALLHITDEIRVGVQKFCTENPWVKDYALYCALKKKYEDLPWWEWDSALMLREEKALCESEKELCEDVFFYSFLQYEFFTQWKAMKEYANKKGISIIGDMPIYLAHDSADVWANPHLFSLDKSMHLTRCAGVPPDYFCEEGQKWGNPLYNWENLKCEGYSLWIKRLGHALSMYDAVRIDHFRAFSAYWSIPAEEKATMGHWEKGPGIEFFDALKKEYPDANIIAEDLGDIDDDVRELLKKTGFPGMGVMQFAFITDDDTPHLPHNYTRKTIGYTGTHDNETLRGFIEASPAHRIDFMERYLAPKDGETLNDAFLRAAWGSVSNIAIAPIQDFLGLGNEARMNTPSTVNDRNWRFRIKNGVLTPDLSEKLLSLNRENNRI